MEIEIKNLPFISWQSLALAISILNQIPFNTLATKEEKSAYTILMQLRESLLKKFNQLEQKKKKETTLKLKYHEANALVIYLDALDYNSKPFCPTDCTLLINLALELEKHF